MKFVNLTPHTLTFIPETGTPREFPPTGTVARAATVSTPSAPIDGIPVVTMAHGETTGIPAPVEDTVFIVSSIAAEGIAKSRTDVFVPTDFVRDDKGNIIGFKTLGKLI